jgi:hypothetical protein
VHSFAEMKAELRSGGKYVVLGPEFADRTTLWSSSIYAAGDTTLDGSEAPNARFTLKKADNSNEAVATLVLEQGNFIVHGLWLDNEDNTDQFNGMLLVLFLNLNDWRLFEIFIF